MQQILLQEILYPRAARGLADLPESLGQLARQVLEPDQAINSILVIPQHTQTQLKRQHTVPLQALAFTTTGVLHVQKAAKASQSPTATYLTGADLLYAHHSLILLYGRLELCGAARGELARIVVEYNIVGQSMLQPPLNQFLASALGPALGSSRDCGQTKALLERLRAESLKFWNGLRLYALQPDEQLLGFAFQPRRVGRRWGPFGGVAAPAALLALTDRAVIFIEEARVTRGAPQGWLITLCPRRCIDRMEGKPLEARRAVCVRLTQDDLTVERQVTVETETARAWEALWLAQGQDAIPVR